MLHVWAADYGFLLAQQAVMNAGQESAVAHELLSNLDVEGATITADAAHCSAETARVIRERKAHYVLALKRNHAQFHDQVEQHFAVALPEKYSEYVTRDAEHGRLEERTVRAMPFPASIKQAQRPWTGLKSVIRVERTRVIGDKSSTTFGYYVSSHPPNAAKIATHIRDHWKIENQLHHVLDVSFGEDRRKIRSEYGAQNFALVCRFALSLFKQDKTKGSVAGKKRLAMWKTSYCLSLLTRGFPAT
jgi:predicted transposase YbfD/YdcC